MKQILNGFKSDYWLSEDGTVFNSKTNRILKYDNRNITLLKEDGTKQRITQKNLYKLVYNKNFCIDTTTTLDNEEWRTIEHTNQLYQISSLGRVKSLCGYVAIVMQEEYSTTGYLKIKIKYDDGITRHKVISGLVANAFPEICGKPLDDTWQVHHKDLNIKNNKADNLIYLSFDEHCKIHSKKVRR